jgi:hypothetical protein
VYGFDPLLPVFGLLGKNYPLGTKVLLSADWTEFFSYGRSNFGRLAPISGIKGFWTGTTINGSVTDPLPCLGAGGAWENAASPDSATRVPQWYATFGIEATTRCDFQSAALACMCVDAAI